jgi:hypothetical protein
MKVMMNMVVIEVYILKASCNWGVLLPTIIQDKPNVSMKIQALYIFGLVYGIYHHFQR